MLYKKKIVYYVDRRGRVPPWEFITSLPSQERDKCFEYLAYLEEMGEKVRRPVGDYIGNKLYELRPKQTRIIYFFMLNKAIVILHAFRKQTNSIPFKDLEIARHRMDDFLNRHQRGFIEL
jgi:phage-related protein